jgi:hypothetical protein
MNWENIWKLTPTKTEVAAVIPSEGVHVLTTSTRFPYRKRGYFISSPRSVIDRLKAAAIQFAQIAILIAGFIVAALCALDLSDMLRW